MRRTLRGSSVDIGCLPPSRGWYCQVLRIAIRHKVIITAIIQRVGNEIHPNNLPQILYEDEDHDKVILASDSDLAAAVDHARLTFVLDLDCCSDGCFDFDQTKKRKKERSDLDIEWFIGIVAGLGLLTYLKRAS
ncbi:hypothetical protein K1719_009991 [Acacia pycnantha]|nr:hypothetical protein K1719_009991 [Acacia pycnantha]